MSLMLCFFSQEFPNYNENNIAVASHTVLCNQDDGTVKSAGCIEVDLLSNGKCLVSLLNISGHYKPPISKLVPARDFLLKKFGRNILVNILDKNCFNVTLFISAWDYI